MVKAFLLTITSTCPRHSDSDISLQLCNLQTQHQVLNICFKLFFNQNIKSSKNVLIFVGVILQFFQQKSQYTITTPSLLCTGLFQD